MAKLLVNRLKKYLSLIFEDFGTKNVDSKLLSGDIQLQNVSLRTALLKEAMGFPNLEVKKAFCSALRIRIPWSKLRSEAVVVTIETLQIVITEPEDLVRCETVILDLLAGKKGGSKQQQSQDKKKKPVVNWNFGLDLAAGVHLTIHKIDILLHSLQGMGKQFPSPPSLRIVISGLNVFNADEKGNPIDFATARKLSGSRKGEVLLFKKCCITAIKLSLGAEDSAAGTREFASLPLTASLSIRLTRKAVALKLMNAQAEIPRVDIVLESSQIPDLLNMMLSLAKCIFRQPTDRVAAGSLSEKEVSEIVALENDMSDDEPLDDEESDNEGGGGDSSTKDLTPSRGGGAGGGGAVTGGATQTIFAVIVARKIAVSMFDTASRPISAVEIFLSTEGEYALMPAKIELKVDQHPLAGSDEKMQTTIATSVVGPPIIVEFLCNARRQRLAHVDIESLRVTYVDPPPPIPQLGWSIQSVVRDAQIRFDLEGYSRLYRYFINPQTSRLLTADPELIAHIFAVESAFCARYSEFSAALSVRGGTVIVPLVAPGSETLSEDDASMPAELRVMFGPTQASCSSASRSDKRALRRACAVDCEFSMIAVEMWCRSLLDRAVCAAVVPHDQQQQQRRHAKSVSHNFLIENALLDVKKKIDEEGEEEGSKKQEEEDPRSKGMEIIVPRTRVRALIPLPPCKEVTTESGEEAESNAVLSPSASASSTQATLGGSDLIKTALSPAFAAAFAPKDDEGRSLFLAIKPAMQIDVDTAQPISVHLNTAAIASLALVGAECLTWAVTSQIMEEQVFWPGFVADVLEHLKYMDQLPPTHTARGVNRVQAVVQLPGVEVGISSAHPLPQTTSSPSKDDVLLLTKISHLAIAAELGDGGAARLVASIGDLQILLGTSQNLADKSADWSIISRSVPNGDPFVHANLEIGGISRETLAGNSSSSSSSSSATISLKSIHVMPRPEQINLALRLFCGPSTSIPRSAVRRLSVRAVDSTILPLGQGTCVVQAGVAAAVQCLVYKDELMDLMARALRLNQTVSKQQSTSSPMKNDSVNDGNNNSNNSNQASPSLSASSPSSAVSAAILAVGQNPKRGKVKVELEDLVVGTRGAGAGSDVSVRIGRVDLVGDIEFLPRTWGGVVKVSWDLSAATRRGEVVDTIIDKLIFGANASGKAAIAEDGNLEFTLTDSNVLFPPAISLAMGPALTNQLRTIIGDVMACVKEVTDVVPRLVGGMLAAMDESSRERSNSAITARPRASSVGVASGASLGALEVVPQRALSSALHDADIELSCVLLLPQKMVPGVFFSSPTRVGFVAPVSLDASQFVVSWHDVARIRRVNWPCPNSVVLESKNGAFVTLASFASIDVVVDLVTHKLQQLQDPSLSGGEGAAATEGPSAADKDDFAFDAKWAEEEWQMCVSLLCDCIALLTAISTLPGSTDGPIFTEIPTLVRNPSAEGLAAEDEIVVDSRSTPQESNSRSKKMSTIKLKNVFAQVGRKIDGSANAVSTPEASEDRHDAGQFASAENLNRMTSTLQEISASLHEAKLKATLATGHIRQSLKAANRLFGLISAKMETASVRGRTLGAENGTCRAESQQLSAALATALDTVNTLQSELDVEREKRRLREEEDEEEERRAEEEAKLALAAAANPTAVKSPKVEEEDNDVFDPFLDPGWKRCAGHLWMQSGVRQQWKHRWIILQNHSSLAIFEHRDAGRHAGDMEIKGQFNPTKFVVLPFAETSRPFAFQLKLVAGEKQEKGTREHRRYVFAADSEREYKEWMVTFGGLCRLARPTIIR